MIASYGKMSKEKLGFFMKRYRRETCDFKNARMLYLRIKEANKQGFVSSKTVLKFRGIRDRHARVVHRLRHRLGHHNHALKRSRDNAGLFLRWERIYRNFDRNILRWRNLSVWSRNKKTVHIRALRKRNKQWNVCRKMQSRNFTGQIIAALIDYEIAGIRKEFREYEQLFDLLKASQYSALLSRANELDFWLNVAENQCLRSKDRIQRSRFLALTDKICLLKANVEEKCRNHRIAMALYRNRTKLPRARPLTVVLLTMASLNRTYCRIMNEHSAFRQKFLKCSSPKVEVHHLFRSLRVEDLLRMSHTLLLQTQQQDDKFLSTSGYMENYEYEAFRERFDEIVAAKDKAKDKATLYYRAAQQLLANDLDGNKETLLKMFDKYDQLCQKNQQRCSRFLKRELNHWMDKWLIEICSPNRQKLCLLSTKETVAVNDGTTGVQNGGEIKRGRFSIFSAPRAPNGDSDQIKTHQSTTPAPSNTHASRLGKRSMESRAAQSTTSDNEYEHRQADAQPRCSHQRNEDHLAGSTAVVKAIERNGNDLELNESDFNTNNGADQSGNEADLAVPEFDASTPADHIFDTNETDHQGDDAVEEFEATASLAERPEFYLEESLEELRQEPDEVFLLRTGLMGENEMMVYKEKERKACFGQFHSQMQKANGTNLKVRRPEQYHAILVNYMKSFSLQYLFQQRELKHWAAKYKNDEKLGAAMVEQERRFRIYEKWMFNRQWMFTSTSDITVNPRMMDDTGLIPNFGQFEKRRDQIYNAEKRAVQLACSIAQSGRLRKLPKAVQKWESLRKIGIMFWMREKYHHHAKEMKKSKGWTVGVEQHRSQYKMCDLLRKEMKDISPLRLRAVNTEEARQLKLIREEKKARAQVIIAKIKRRFLVNVPKPVSNSKIRKRDSREKKPKPPTTSSVRVQKDIECLPRSTRTAMLFQHWRTLKVQKDMEDNKLQSEMTAQLAPWPVEVLPGEE